MIWCAGPTPSACDSIIAIATDRFGQINYATACINVIAPTNAAPVAVISNLVNEIIDSHGHRTPDVPIVREGLFVLTGSAYLPGSTNSAYALHVLSPAGDFVQDLTPLPRNSFGFYSGSVTTGTLATCDFTLLRNGVYELELVVQGNYQQANATVLFRLESDLKIGQFSFSEQDMVIPVSGIPLTIIRTYDSLKANSPRTSDGRGAGGEGDFGAGWTFAINDVDMQIDEQRQLVESVFADDDDYLPAGPLFSLRTGGGRDVTLTLPDGRRTTFAYSLVPGACNSGDEIDLCATPTWTAPPGVNARLRPIVDNKLAFLLNSGLEWWTDDGSAAPENYDFSGFILTMGDGTEYRIDREDHKEHWFLSDTNYGYAHVYGAAHVTQIKPRGSGDIIYIQNPQRSEFRIVQTNAAGILSRSIVCQRDADGHIVAIRDPNGQETNAPPALTYEYAGGNLIAVNRLKDKSDPAHPVYVSTHYDYTNVNYPHYITGIRDGRGVTVAKNLYSDDGRLIGIVDAFGNTNRFVHDLNDKKETVFDRMGNQTIHFFDTKGNVTTTIDALSHATQRSYDGSNRVDSVTDALTNMTRFISDQYGNRVKIIDAMNRTNSALFDSFGNDLSHTDPVGNVSTNVFDELGNPTSWTKLDASNNVAAKGTATFDGRKLIETRNAKALGSDLSIKHCA